MSGDTDGQGTPRSFRPGGGGGDRPWLVPALAAGAGLVLVLLLIGIGALVLSNRSDNTAADPTQTRAAVILPPSGTPTTTRTAGGATTGRATPAGGGTGAATTARATTATQGATTAATGTGNAFTVSGTDGEGVRLRAEPGGDVITSVPEGTRLEQIGPDRQVGETNWRNVRTPEGQQGWVAAQFTTAAP